MTDADAKTIEHQRRHIEMLQLLDEATSELAAAATPDEVANVILTSGLRALGADAGFLAIYVPERSVLRVSRFAGYDSIPAERLELDADANLPIALAVRMRTALYIGSNDELACDHPGVRRLDPADHACASIPLILHEDLPPLGAINVRFNETREFGALDRRLLDLLATRCSQAMARAMRFEQERERRVAAEDALVTSRALELNDDIVQLIAEAKLALELGLTEQAGATLGTALTAGKRVLANMTAGATTFRLDRAPLDGVERVDQ